MTRTALASLVSPYVGVARSLEERLVSPGDARTPVYTAELAADDRLLGGRLDHVGALCGIGGDRSEASAAALGEAAERYSLSYLPRRRLVIATAAQLGPTAVDPRRFALFTSAQYEQPGFPFVPFTREARTTWIDGWHVSTREPAWLPAELVFLADVAEPGSPRIAYATSSGAACGDDEDGAVLRGLLELLERDAFMIVWAARLTLPLLDWSGHARLRELDERYFAPAGLRYAAVDLSCFHKVPTVLAVVRAPLDETAALGVGAGAAATVETAWCKALAEAFGTRSAARARVAAGERRAFAPDGADVVTFGDHIVFHSSPGRASISAFLDASAESVDPASVPDIPGGAREQIAMLAERIVVAGSDAYAVDVTAPDVASVGLRVVKTLAPELAMLDVPHAARFLGCDRLRRAPADVGLVTRPLTEAGLNPYPHPFP